jgi:hypothetical protein
VGKFIEVLQFKVALRKMFCKEEKLSVLKVAMIVVCKIKILKRLQSLE